MRIPYEQLCTMLSVPLRLRGFSSGRAAACARVFAENSLVGVSSHGLNRYPRFIQWLEQGWVRPKARPELVAALGSLERWDGCRGPGPLNAMQSMKRAMQLAAHQGLGCVALRNTNHWMRAGTYVTQAAESGFLGLCFTNTEPNLPPWGGKVPMLGNNPLAVAVPRANGRHLIFDAAMSQYSYGTLEKAAGRGETLPVPGGYSGSGELTDNPSEILDSKRALPIGYWKGSGLALMLDLFAATLSSGATTQALGRQEAEYGVSQIFLAFDRTLLDNSASSAIEQTLMALGNVDSADGARVRYPGERLYRCRDENLRLGVPVDSAVWAQIQKIVAG